MEYEVLYLINILAVACVLLIVFYHYIGVTKETSNADEKVKTE